MNKNIPIDIKLQYIIPLLSEQSVIKVYNYAEANEKRKTDLEFYLQPESENFWRSGRAEKKSKNQKR